MSKMWMLPPIIMCRRHIGGEHSEAPHKQMPSMLRGDSIRGRYYHADGRKRHNPQIELCSIRSRHEELAGYLNHRSPLPDNFEDVLKVNYPEFYNVKIDRRYTFWQLWLRCPDCRRLMSKHPDVSRRVLGGGIDEATVYTFKNRVL